MWVKVVQTSPNHGDSDPKIVPLFSYTTSDSQNEDFLVSLLPFNIIFVKMPQGDFLDSETFWARPFVWDTSSGLGEWHHLAITGTPPENGQSKLMIYVDGEPIDTNENLIPAPNQAPVDGGSVVLAQGQSAYKTLHHGHMHVAIAKDNYITFLAEVRFWNLARDPDQIFANSRERCTSLETRYFPHPCLCTSRPVNKNETRRKVTLHAPIPHPSRRITVPEDGLVAVWSLNCNFNDVVGTHGFGRL